MSTFAEWRAKNKKEEEQTVPQSESSASTFKEWRKSHKKDGGTPITQGQLGDVTTAMREQAQRDYLRSKYVEQAAQKSAIEQYHSQYNDAYQKWRKQNILEAGAPAREARMQKAYGAGYDQQKFDAVESWNADADKYYNAYVGAMENGGVDPATGMSDVDAAAAWQNAHKYSYDGWDANTRAAYDRYQYAQIPKSADFRDYTANRPVNPTREQTADRIVGEGDDRTFIKGQAIADPVGLYLNANDADKYDAMSMGTETGGLDAYGSVMQRGQNEAWDLLKDPKYSNLLDTYYYLLNKEGMDSAMKYMDSIAITLQRDKAETESEAYQKAASEANLIGKIGMSAASVMSNSIGGVIGFADNMIRTVQGKETNPYTAAHSATNFSQGVRSGIAEDIDRATGFVDEQGRRTNKKGLFGGNFTWGSLYQSAMSTGDMLFNAPLGGTVYGAMMGMGASESAAKELYEKGASNGQIFWGSIMSGAIEMLTEKYSMESLINIGDSKTIMAALWNTAKQGFTEGSEEFFSEIGNAIFDLLNMKDKSDIMEMYNENGQDVGKTIVQLLQQAGDAFLGGFFSGALSGGAKSFFGTERTENGQRRATGYLPYVQQFNAEGAAIRSSTSGVHGLFDMNAEMNSDSTYKDSEKARKAAEAETKRKVEQAYRNRGKLQGIAEMRANIATGRMLDSISEGYAKASSNEIAAKLTNAGMKKGEVDKIAPAIAARINGTSMTNLQQEALEDALNSRNMAVRRVISEIITDSESQTIKGSERLDDYAKAVRSNITLKAQAAFTGTEEQKREKAKEAIGNDMKVSEDGKTIDNATGAEVTLDAKPIVMNDGKLELKLTNGSTVSASDLSFGSDNESLIFGALAKTVMNTDDADAVYQYLNSINEADLPSHAAAVVEAYRFGAHGISTDNKALLGFSSVLPDTVRTLANNAGKTQYGSQQYKARQFRKGMGTVRYDGLNEQEVKRNANAQQRTAIRTAEFLAAAGFDIEIFESKVDEKSKRVGENGQYVDGKIRIDLYSGGSGEGMMAYTIAHEATHQIEEMSPAEFHAYADSLFVALGDKGIDVNSKVIATLERVRGMDAYKGKSEDQLWNIAYSEVVAEATETMLTDTNAIEKLSQRISLTDKALWGKIKNVFSSIANRLREAYRNMKPDSDIARAARSVISNHDNLVDLWVKAAQNAMENFTEGQREVQEAISGAESSYDSMYVRDGKMESATDFESELKQSTRFDADYMAKAMEMNKTVDADIMQKAMKDRATIRGILERLQNDPNIGMPEDVLGNTYIANSSYDGTEENTTICPRSLAQEAFMDAVSEYLGRPLTVAEQVYISQDLQGRTATPECLYCYVATDRKAYREFLGKYIQQRDAVLKKIGTGMDEQSYTAAQIEKLTEEQKKNSLYLEFLGDRKATKNMQKRYDMWLNTYKSGQRMIDSNDLASISKLMGDKAANFGADVVDQIKDALAYAQSASWAKKRVSYLAYNNHILKWGNDRIKKLNSHYGLRMYSFSDYSPAFILENMQMVTDASVRGLKMLAYTKEIDFAKIFASTGMNINISCFGFESGGNVYENNIIGAKWEEAQQLRRDHDNVGVTFVATSDKLVEWALAQDWIDVVIPYHLVRTGAEVAEALGYTNYTSESGDGKAADWKEWSKGRSKKELVTSISPVMHNNDKATYMKALAEHHLTPRFARWVDNPSYMKLVNECRRSASESTAVQPVFDVDAARESLAKMEAAGYYTPIGGSVDRMYEIAAEIGERIHKGNLFDTIQSSEILQYIADVGETLRKAIANAGNIETPYNQKRIAKVTDKISAMVLAASNGKTDISGKYFAVNGSELWHEYQRHSDEGVEISRDQIAMTSDDFAEAITAVFDPDIVECVFPDGNNSGKRASFAYAKQTKDGNYVVVEAVGGRKNPNITPIEVIQVTKHKWNAWIGNGKTLGEMIHEHKQQYLSELDIEANKKNRVTAAQFASDEAIANTLRSPQFATTVTQPSESVKLNSARDTSDFGSMSYAELQEEIRNNSMQYRDLTIKRQEAEDSPAITSAMEEYANLGTEMKDLFSKRHRGVATEAELKRIEEIKALRDDAMERVRIAQEESGLAAVTAKLRENQERANALREASDKAWEREGAAKERAAIEKSGMSAAEYFRKKAVKAFHYTANFNEAGYMLPDGKLLNFSGGERNHRYRDHREIGEIYEATQGTQALNRFLADGNIRIMAESPGVDIAGGVEPTAEQYAMLRKFINSHGVRDGEFYIDFSDKDGRRMGSYSYNGSVNTERVINDIKYFYQNGTTREQSSLAAFYSMRDSDGGVLSKEQQEYFKDSKVRDADGNLMVMYHGTPNATFTVFRKGSYFTADPEYAATYKNQGASSNGYKRTADNPDVYRVYLNIKKPFDISDPKCRRIFINEYVKGGYANGINPYQTDAEIRKQIANGIDWTEADNLMEFLEENEYDYDGLVLDEGGVFDDAGNPKPRGRSYVVLSEGEQVKNVDNKTPTSDPDIRYSERQQGADDSKQNEKLKKDVSDLRELVKLQGKLTGGTMATQASITKQTNRLLRMGNSAMDKVQLSKELNDFYRFLATDKDYGWEDVRQRADAIAAKIIKAQKPGQMDGYAREVLTAIRGTTVRLTDEQKRIAVQQYGNLSNFRKALHGFVNFSDNAKLEIDSAWSEWAEEYPSIFDADTVSGDQAIALADAIEDLRNTREQVNVSELREALTEQIYDSYWDLTTVHTVADKWNRKLNESEGKWIEKMTELKERHAERIQEVREQRDRKIQQIKDHNAEVNARYKDRTLRTQKRHQVWKAAQELERLLSKPTNGKYVPKELVTSVIEVMETLDLETGKSEKRNLQISKLESIYNRMKGDSDYAIYHNEVIEKMLNELTQTIGDTNIMDMSIEQLDDIHTALKALKHTISEATKVRIGKEEHDAYEMSVKMTRETESARVMKNKLLRKWTLSMLRPQAAFERFGGYAKDNTWSRVFTLLNDGQLKQTRLTMEGQQIFAELLQDQKSLDKLISTKKGDLVDIGLKDRNGETVEITRGMMLSIYMHLQNEDNMRHFARGGVTVPELKAYYGGKYKDAFGIGRHETAAVGENGVKDVLAKINGYMTDYDRAWAKAAQKFFDGFSKDTVNAATMEMYGFKKASVENYFPIRTDPNYRAHNFESISRDMTLENAGFMKDRVHASNPILLEDITDVVNSQIARVAQYAAIAPAIMQFNKVYSKVQTEFAGSIQSAVTSKFGAEGKHYIENVIADIQGARKADRNIFDELRGAQAAAVLTLSVRTTLAQAASYPSAAAIVGKKALAKAFLKGGKDGRMISRADKELIAKYSPLLWLRMQGYSSEEMGSIKDSKVDKVMKKMRWLTGWIQAMDGATVGRLWYAAEYYVQDNHSDLQHGTDAYYEEVAKVFNKIVEETQPDYTTMQRPDILRNPNALVKQLTMYMTQRLQNTNIMYDATQRAIRYQQDFKAGRNGVTAEDVHDARSRMMGAYLSQMVAAATIVAFKGLADILMHSVNPYRDKDKELTVESVSLGLLNNFMDTLIGNVLWGSQVYDYAKKAILGEKYYGISLSGVEVVQDLLDYSNKFIQQPNMKNGEKLAMQISKFFGMPIENAKKIASAFYLHGKDIANGEFFSFEAGVERAKTIEEHRFAVAAVVGDKAKAESIDLTTSERQKGVQNSFEEGEITDAQAARILADYCDLSAPEAKNLVEFWKWKAKVGDAAKGWDVKAYTKYMEYGDSVGISLEMWNRHKAAVSGLSADKDENGKSISGSKKAKVLEAINSLPLTAKQKDSLYYAEGYSAKDIGEAPWH